MRRTLLLILRGRNWDSFLRQYPRIYKISGGRMVALYWTRSCQKGSGGEHVCYSIAEGNRAWPRGRSNTHQWPCEWASGWQWLHMRMKRESFLSFLWLLNSWGLWCVVEGAWAERDKEGLYEKAKLDSLPTLAHLSELFANWLRKWGNMISPAILYQGENSSEGPHDSCSRHIWIEPRGSGQVCLYTAAPFVLSHILLLPAHLTYELPPVPMHPLSLRGKKAAHLI